MKNIKIICYFLVITGITLIATGLTIQDSNISTSAKVDTKNMYASVNMTKSQKDKNEDVDLEELLSTQLDITPASLVVVKSFDEMTIEEKQEALNNGTLEMQYSAWYTFTGEGLSVSRGAMYYNGHKETYYSEKVLPGNTLPIPGRHVADDGTIRDADGFICVAADPAFLPKGSTVITSLGPAKVYDSGCSYGIVDIYVSW